MSDITPIGFAAPPPKAAAIGRSGAGSATQEAGASQGVSRGSDRVELSQLSQLLSKLHGLPEVRQDLIDRVKGEIAAGTYESNEKIDQAINALGEDLA